MYYIAFYHDNGVDTPYWEPVVMGVHNHVATPSYGVVNRYGSYVARFVGWAEARAMCDRLNRAGSRLMFA
jgi:hypothetical protein